MAGLGLDLIKHRHFYNKTKEGNFARHAKEKSKVRHRQELQQAPPFEKFAPKPAKHITVNDEGIGI